MKMRQLVTTAMLMASMGCASAPEAPAAPEAAPVIEAKPVEPTPEPVPAFNVGDLVTVTFPDGMTAGGLVVGVGPMAIWSKTQTISRVYLVKAVVDGIDGVGKVPEFALTKRVQ